MSTQRHNTYNNRSGEYTLDNCYHFFQVCERLNDPQALKIAKTNVLRHFPVVGVLEMFNSTLKVLESKLPEYFSGVTEIAGRSFLEAYEEENMYNTNQKEVAISDEVFQMLQMKINNEIEFYEFCVQRLKRQLVNGTNN